MRTNTNLEPDDHQTLTLPDPSPERSGGPTARPERPRTVGSRAFRPRRLEFGRGLGFSPGWARLKPDLGRLERLFQDSADYHDAAR
jgi:hypothetical protein